MEILISGTYTNPSISNCTRFITIDTVAYPNATNLPPGCHAIVNGKKLSLADKIKESKPQRHDWYRDFDKNQGRGKGKAPKRLVK